MKIADHKNSAIKKIAKQKNKNALWTFKWLMRQCVTYTGWR